jgi:mannose-6-phosphate isomerase-like protein (cupin superfamily)
MEPQVTTGDGYSVASLDALGEGPGFRKVRKPLGVTAFGVNALVIPTGYGGNYHSHEEQEELYFVHQGRARFEFGDGSSHEVGTGGLVWVAPPTVRHYESIGEEDLILLCVGGKDGYVGRDGRVAEGTERVTRPE